MGIRVDRLKRERKGVRYYSGNGDERFETRLYNDSSKEYWNKSSGKWVKRSFKNYIDEFFYWNEYENLNERLIVSWFKSYELEEEVKDEYFKYIDKVGYFIYWLIQKERNNLRDRVIGSYVEIYIGIQDCERILGKEYKVVLKVLEYNKILLVEVGKKIKYNANKRFRYVKFKKEVLGKYIGKRYIENKVLAKGILKEYQHNPSIGECELNVIKRMELIINPNDLDIIVEEKVLKKINDYKLKIEWGEDKKSKIESYKEWLSSDKKEYEDSIRERYNYYVEALSFIKRGLISPNWFGIDEFSGRKYNIINSMDKEFRRNLLLDGESVVELDMRSAHLACLIYFIERFTRIGINGFGKERNALYKRYGGKSQYISLIKNSRFSEEPRSEFYINYISHLETNWKYRKQYWYELSGSNKGYDWGNVKGNNIDSIFNSLKYGDNSSNNLFKELFNEYVGVVKSYREINTSKLFQGINENYDDFYLSDTFIKEIYKGYLFDVENGKWSLKQVEFTRSGFGYEIEVNRTWSKKDYKLYFQNTLGLSVESIEDVKKYVQYFLDNEVEGTTLIRYGVEGYKKWSEINKFWLLPKDISEVDKRFSNLNYNYEERILFELFGNKMERMENSNREVIRVVRLEDFVMSITEGKKRVGKKRLGKWGSLRLINENKSWLESNNISLNNVVMESNPLIYNNYFGEIDREVENKFYSLLKDYKERYGEKDEFEVKGNYEIDYWDNKQLFNSFIFLKKMEIVFGKDKIGGIDFYNFIKTTLFGFNQLGGKYHAKIFGEYGREYWKKKFMRLIFQKNHLNNYLDRFGGYDKNLGDLVFGEEVWKLINSIRQMNLIKDEYGDYFKFVEKDKHKIMSKVLGLIEVDVMNFLKSRLNQNGIPVVGIFDGLVIKEKDYWRIRFEANSILKNEVGYMFEMR